MKDGETIENSPQGTVLTWNLCPDVITEDFSSWCEKYGTKTHPKLRFILFTPTESAKSEYYRGVLQRAIKIQKKISHKR